MAEVPQGRATTVMLTRQPQRPGARGPAGQKRWALVLLGPDGLAECAWVLGDRLGPEAAAALLRDRAWIRRGGQVAGPPDSRLPVDPYHQVSSRQLELSQSPPAQDRLTAQEP